MPFFAAAPTPDDPRDRELEALREFVARIRAEYAEPGHITRAEIKAALTALDVTPRVLQLRDAMRAQGLID